VVRRVDEFDPESFRRFCDVEASGWKGRAKTAIASAADTLRFYEEVAREAARLGYLTFYFLESNGRTVAAQFGLTYRGRYFLVKAGYDESFAKFGPGHLLVLAVLRDCWQRGLWEFDFLGPWMEDEARWTERARAVEHAWILRKGLYGRLLHTLAFPIKERVKKLLRLNPTPSTPTSR
jgi:CelD/BcsL family acetyltransferase involved in cellulose biosynthesis